MLRARVTLHQWRMRRALEALHDGGLAPSQHTALVAHARDCLACAAVLRRLKQHDRMLTAARPAAPCLTPEQADAVLEQVLRTVAPSASRLSPTFRRPALVYSALGIAMVAAVGVLLVARVREGRTGREPVVVGLPKPVTTVSPPSGVNLTPLPPLRRGEGGLGEIVRVIAPSILSPPSPRRRGGQGGEVNPPRWHADAADRDLDRLNEGSVEPARPMVPLVAVSEAPPLPVLPERGRGDRLVDDLLLLNPVRVAAAGDGLGAAAAALKEDAPTTDPRLKQKVTVHAVNREFSSLLTALSKATGVSLSAHLEVADQRATIWADDRSLLEVMRDLRHLYGYYWSRAKRDGRYVYSLWQDAESRAREDAEVQRMALDLQREFQERVRKQVDLLDATEAELRQLAEEDPYLLAKISHPVARAAFQLFGALSPDQQARLLHGGTPSGWMGGGGIMEMWPRRSTTVEVPGSAGGTVRVDADQPDPLSPSGDIVTLRGSDLTSAQKRAVASLFTGAATQWQREAERRRRDSERRIGYWFSADEMLARAKVATEANLSDVTIRIFRAGDPTSQRMSLRVDFTHGKEAWLLYSSFAPPFFVDKGSSERLLQGVENHLWAGGQEAIDRYRRGDARRKSVQASAATLRAENEPPDPILDRRLSFTWRLRPGDWNGSDFVLSAQELHQALQREIGCPVLVTGMSYLMQPKAESDRFRWSNRSVRQLLRRLFPEHEPHTHGGAIFLRHPKRNLGRLNAIPPAVERLMASQLGHGPWTLDDLVLVARSLTPWQVSRIDDDYLRASAIEELLAVQELLKLYGELSPSQRRTVANGLAVSALTPTQQAHFMAFAQRHRPSVESWRFQQGAVQIATEAFPLEARSPGEPMPATRAVFTVRFQEGDVQTYPMGLPDRPERWYLTSLAELVGKPFTYPFVDYLGREKKPVLPDERLRQKPYVAIFYRAPVEPFVGIQPPPDTLAWVRSLATRLKGTGTLVAAVAMDEVPGAPALRQDPSLPNLIALKRPADEASTFGFNIDRTPTVVVVDRNEIVRAVFEGTDAWDLAAVERAARDAASIKTSVAK